MKEIQKQGKQNILINVSLIPDLGVSTAILNTIDISRRCCKLNFGPLQGQVKARNFPERIDARRNCLYFPHKFIGAIGRKRLGQAFWIMIWIYYYLFNKITLDLDLENSNWIRKRPNFATVLTTFGFSHITLTPIYHKINPSPGRYSNIFRVQIQYITKLIRA